ncbi:MAG: hypothetical protein J6N55_06620 [Anaerovibrio sp.]|uniref:hypothetical protein n=1 Tax=Anaerovibrio sp. TaxID=1872532 RepID=UPI001B060B98|nr:hypothetical protein [Anaerovibrio sp.]MBO6245936.1 hypothetical protein [Anaerovibrio sp.]
MGRADERRKIQYDKACKEVLSEKGIIGHILKTCVREYENVSIEDIVNKYVQGTPEVEKILVQPDDVIYRIESQHTEDSSEGENAVFFDVRFTALAPDTEELIELIINIEAQNKFNPGYPLLKRGIYYCSRMISGQYGTVFTKSHYEKIKKVYSIWVCTNSNKEWEYNIARYGIIEENIIGKAKAKTSHYDLLSVVMICLGKKQYTELEGLLRLLNLVLVDNDLKQQEKKNKLAEEFSIKMTPRLERGVQEMCNLSEGIEQRGIEKGIAQGREQMANETVIEMLKGKMSVDMIARFTKLTVEQVKEIGKKNALI